MDDSKGSDGKYFVAALGTPPQWRRFAGDVLDRPDLLTDERSHRGTARVKNKVPLAIVRFEVFG
jgi:crotonobetainyl-CoA:carnitine CoA-transferase CaiB-like acyl-CoA transferase